MNIPHHATLKEIRNWYNVSYATIQKWLSKVPALGKPRFGRAGYSREQIEIIFKHLEPPEKFEN